MKNIYIFTSHCVAFFQLKQVKIARGILQSLFSKLYDSKKVLKS